MYSVTVEKECGCFKKSEYQKEKSFERKEDAFLYSKALEELMNEEFCSKHIFFTKETGEKQYTIRVVDNPNGGGCCGGGHCG
ncbi:MAG TPA: hypothetical protein ENK86_02400 [Campylobacterales bacterium]|nr:hypothetical protein [Campylobacterales bacterium]